MGSKGILSLTTEHLASMTAEVPPELLQKVKGRVRLFALGAMDISLIGLLISLILPNLELPTVVPAVKQLRFVAIFMGACSIGMYAYARREASDPKRVIDAALVFQVMVGIALALVEFLRPHDFRDVPYGVSFNCVLVMAFALLVPAKPIKMAAAAFAVACVGPLVEGISAWTGGPHGNLTYAALRYWPNFFCAASAVGASRFVYQMTLDFGEAKQLGSYQLEALLGKGGMGEVWRADHQMLARPAAVKLIRPERLGAADGSTNHAVIKRFEREARATAALQSPHSIHLYDFGITEDGTLYYVMELLDGLDLERLGRSFGPQPAERVVYLLRQAAMSLVDAHERGLIHRDIKPANIFACRLGPHRDVVKVLDFGLVKQLADPSESATKLTADGVASGTPAYMAPEAATGAHPVDARTDLYALGCVAYWLLTGQLVFEGKTPMAVVIEHVNSTPVPPSDRSELRIPEALDALVMQLLEKDPADRPADARELVRRLDAVDIERPWTEARAEAWWKTHQPPATVDEGAATQTAVPDADAGLPSPRVLQVR